MSRFIARNLYLAFPLVLACLLALCVSSARAQFQASITQLSPILPFSNIYGDPPRVVGGTAFPWYDRLGNFVTTLSQNFRLTGTLDFDLSRVTVTVDGHNCVVIQTNPFFDPTLGMWIYNGAPFSINVGSGPGQHEFVAQYYYDGQPIPEGVRGGVARRLVYVCKVEPVDSPMVEPDDQVRTTSNL
jgi:hypothetical protein